MSLTDDATYSSRVRGCILGGAVGDALGDPVEFRSTHDIFELHPHGVRDFVKPIGEITDDTQMTLFTLEGLIRSNVGGALDLGAVDHAYRRWYDTQTLCGPSGKRDGWLQAEQWLYVQRAPGTTCMNALHSADPDVFGGAARNDSKGCGGVMRSAPFGLVPSTDGWAFDAAATCAGFTHGHITGRLASGALAVIIRNIVIGEDLNAALKAAIQVLQTKPGHDETLRALQAADDAARSGEPSVSTLESLGGGWIAEEALAIAVYAALAYPASDQFLDALSLAVSHGGDSDSTGAICGNILGALHGEDSVPADLAARLEGRAAILELIEDFIAEFTSGRVDGRGIDWGDRYPGW